MDGASDVDELKAALAAREAELAAERARRIDLEAQVAKLTDAVREMQLLLGRNSSNSNRPPSSDPPGTSPAPKKPPTGRRRGGQKGHRGSYRMLVPAERVDEVVDVYPPECQSCWEPLPKTADPLAKRYQYTELKPLAVHVTEYRRHAVRCQCGYKSRVAFDSSGIPRIAFGPRLRAVAAMLTGVYHLSRRQTERLLLELLGVRMSLGSVSTTEKRVSESVAPAVDEVLDVARDAAIKHADGTNWLRSGAILSLWVIATTAVTVFKVLDNGRADTLENQLFVRTRGTLVSDRATALKFWVMRMRQICWAHLYRKFVSLSERDGPAGTIGKELLEYTRLLFTYWAEFRQGVITRATLISRMAPVRPLVEALLERAVAAEVKDLSGSCADILEHREALWTFVERQGVEPTNNHAERELRGFVLWRRRSFGSKSERGDRFAERLMTVAHTARKQGRDVLAFLVACCARPAESPTPSLLAAT